MSARQLSRRTVLRGAAGLAVGLPLLEAMLPRGARSLFAAEAVSRHPLRVGYFFVPNGMNMADWRPENEGTLGKLPKILEPLDKYKSRINVLSGLTLNGGRALGDGPGDHARAAASFLTGAHPKKTDGADILNGASIDQVIAEKVGSATRLPSLELGSEGSSQAGRCDSGYSCAYVSNLAWRTETSPVAKENDPAAVFERLFGAGDPKEFAKIRAAVTERRKSVLDFVREDAASLQKELGAKDRQKLEEYLYAVRDVERRIAAPDKLIDIAEDLSDYPRPKGVPREYEEHINQLLDLIVLAWKTDSTRVVTFMYANAGSNRSYKNLDIGDGHHNLSHHGRDDEKLTKIAKINRFHIDLFARFVGKLHETREGDGSLLDHSLLVYGSGLGDGDRHNHEDLPILQVGGANGTIKTGRHLKYDRDTPLCNLYVSTMNRMGVPGSTFSDSTGPLKGLEG